MPSPKSILDVMTPNPIAMDSTTPVLEAARCMRDHKIGNVIVLDEGQVIGIVTDRDVVTRCIAEGRNPESTDLGDICTREVTTLSPGDTVDTAIRLMRTSSVRRLPVVQQGKPIGIVSLGDLAVTRDPSSVLGDISADPPNS